MYVLVGVVPPFVLPAMYVLVLCGTTPLCWLQCMRWLVWYRTIVLLGMYVLAGVVPPHCVGCNVCAGWCAATPLCCLLCM